MNGPEHRLIVTLAFRALREGGWDELAALEPAVLSACMLPDQVAIPLLQGKPGPWRAFFPRQALRFNFEQDMRDLHALMPRNRFYLRGFARALRAGRAEEAGRFLGVYSHYVGDFAQPAHYYELHIANLLPPPPSWRNGNYHRMLEDVGATCDRPLRAPRLLAAGLPELEFRLAASYAPLHRRAMAAVVPMVRAVYRRDRAVAGRVLSPVVAHAAALFADFCLTAWCIARRRLPAALPPRLRTCPLHDLPPHAYDAEFNFSHRPLVDFVTRDAVGRAEPFRLTGPDGAARTVRGVCVVPHALPIPGVQLSSMLEYRLPAGVFARFVAYAGLLAGAEPQAPCRFEVVADGRRLARTPLLRPGDPAVALDLGIRGARRLRLNTITDGSTDKLAFPIWGEPRLFRS